MMLPVVVTEPEKKPGILQRIFGKKDTTAKKEEAKPIDPKAKLKADIEKLKDERRAKGAFN